jgi:hypothetical protein
MAPAPKKRPVENGSEQPAKTKTDTKDTKTVKTGTLPVFSKPKLGTVASPRRKPDNKNQTRALCISSTQDGCSLAWIEGPDGTPAYNFPMASFLREDANRSRSKYKVDLAKVRRDPMDMNKVWEFPPKREGGSISLFSTMIHIPDSANEDGPEFRNKWGPLLVDLHNMKRFLHKIYGSNNLAFFAGDLTPTSGKKPYLSDYFTIKHTLEVIHYAFSDQTMDGILAQDTLMQYYFPKEKIEEVREYYKDRIKPRNENNDDQEGAPEAPLPEWHD